MTRYMVVAVSSGGLFALMDALINANPFAQKLYEVYRPVARTSVNAPAGIAIDLAYGFIMAGVFLLLYQSLPGARAFRARRSLLASLPRLLDQYSGLNGVSQRCTIGSDARTGSRRCGALAGTRGMHR